MALSDGENSLGTHRLIIASASPRRLALLKQIGLEPDQILPVTINELPGKRERPRALAQRLAGAKAQAAAEYLESKGKKPDWVILSADTTVALGRRLYPKVENREAARATLAKLSGRTHRVFTAIELRNAKGRSRRRLVETRVHFKRLSRQELDDYLLSGEWRDKAGAYAIQGLAGAFVTKLIGSYSNVVGLPLYETRNLLTGAGFDVTALWPSGGAI